MKTRMSFSYVAGAVLLSISLGAYGCEDGGGGTDNENLRQDMEYGQRHLNLPPDLREDEMSGTMRQIIEKSRRSSLGPAIYIVPAHEELLRVRVGKSGK